LRWQPASRGVGLLRRRSGQDLPDRRPGALLTQLDEHQGGNHEPVFTTIPTRTHRPRPPEKRQASRARTTRGRAHVGVSDPGQTIVTPWHLLRLSPPTVAELLAAEPLLKEIDPALVRRGLALLKVCSHEWDPAIVFLHLLQRRRFGPVPVSRLLVRALLVLSGHPVRPLSFHAAFRPSRQSPPSTYRLSEILVPVDGEAAA